MFNQVQSLGYSGHYDQTNALEAVQTKPSLLREAIDGQSNIIGELHQMASALRGRLAPLMTPEPPNATGAVKGTPTASTVSQTLRDHNSRIADIGGLISDILNRLEV